MIKHPRRVLILAMLVFGAMIAGALFFFVDYELWQELLAGCIAGPLVAWFLSSIFAFKLPGKIFIMTPEGLYGAKKDFIVKFEKPCWAWSSFLSEGAPGFYKQSYKQEAVRLDVSCSPLLLNIIISRDESPEAVLALDQFINESEGKWSSLGEIARYVAYEFAHNCRGKVGDGEVGFYNPLEPTHQATYMRELTKALADFLESQGFENSQEYLYIGRGSHFILENQPYHWAPASALS